MSLIAHHPWTFLVPFKDSRAAKSRLRLPERLRGDVAVAMVFDTVEQLLLVPEVSRVLVICDRPDDVASMVAWPRVEVHAAPGPGLNGAIRFGEATAKAADPLTWVAVCPADMPALDPRELARVLGWCAAYLRCVVPDRRGTGTTMLTAGANTPLSPAFGPGSLAAHTASGAAVIELPDESSLRHDVDEPADLERVRRLAPRSRTARARACALSAGR